MTPILTAALDLQSFMDRRHWSHCIIGGIALLRWGEPRFTRDVDVTLLTGFGSEDEFIGPLLEKYQARIPDSAEFARRNRVLLLTGAGGVPLDVALGGLPFEAKVVERSQFHELAPGCRLRIASAEDLVVQKLFAFRQRDIMDVETIAMRQQARLDWDYVSGELLPLAELKEQPEILDRLRSLRARYQR